MQRVHPSVVYMRQMKQRQLHVTARQKEKKESGHRQQGVSGKQEAR